MNYHPHAYRRRLIDLFQNAVDETVDALIEYGCETVSELQDHIDANEIVMGLIDHVDTVTYDEEAPAKSQQTGWDIGNSAQILAQMIAENRRDMAQIVTTD